MSDDQTTPEDDQGSSEGREYAPDQEPATEDLEEPSVAKEPGEEPKAPEQKDEEPSHHAVGVGVIDDES